MHMEVSSDEVVRTVRVMIEGGPVLNNEWATWRKAKRPFKLIGLILTIRGVNKLEEVLIYGPRVLKGGLLSESDSDSVRLYPKDVDRAPRWLQTLVLDAGRNVKAANYPDPEGGTLENPIGVGS